MIQVCGFKLLFFVYPASIILLLDWTSKRHITSNKYFFMTSHVELPEYIVNHQDITDDKGKMKNNHCTALQLLQKFVKYVRIHSNLSTFWVRDYQARYYNIIHIEKSCKEREKMLTIHEIEKGKRRISNQPYTKLAKLRYNLQRKWDTNLSASDFFNIFHPCYYLYQKLK